MLGIESRPTTISEKKEASENCKCCELKGDNGEPTPCCCSIPCYTYAIDIWNTLDMLMILSGTTGLALHNVAAASVSQFTIQEFWHVAFIDQLSNVSTSLCVVIAFFRILDFLIHWEYIGVLVITVFYMMSAIVRFVILFIFISIGFSAAFHMLYDNNPIYSNFPNSVLTTSIGIFSGYQIPDFSNLLFYPNAPTGYSFQVACVIIGVVLLLNFLIAMMNSIYNSIQENSTSEYRWLMTSEIAQLQYTPWPVPLNLLQGCVACGCFCKALLTDDWDSLEPPENKIGHKVHNDTKTLLYANMTISYFRETLSEEQYKSSLLFDHLEGAGEEPNYEEGSGHEEKGGDDQ